MLARSFFAILPPPFSSLRDAELLKPFPAVAPSRLLSVVAPSAA